MSNTAETLMSVAEFLAWEREQPERYEYAGGVVAIDRRLSRPRDDYDERRIRIATVLTGQRMSTVHK
jgi:hypothetical protein